MTDATGSVSASRSDGSRTAVASESSLRILALVAYGLFVLAFSNGVSAIVGVVIAYLKRDEARGTPYESHFTNMIRVFWSAVALTVLFIAALGVGAVNLFSASEPHLTLPLVALGAGIWLGVVVFVVFYLYRIIKGFALALDGNAYR
jgi:uncharacterized membrane protein